MAIRKINESQIRNLVSKAMKERLFEMSRDTISKASERSDRLFSELGRKFDEFYDVLYDYLDEDYDGNWLEDVAGSNRSILEIRKHAEAIRNILDRKLRQRDNLEGEADRLDDIVAESIRKVVNEGIYDYPDGIDHILFLVENDRECYDVYWSIVKALFKKSMKGVELSAERLTNSPVMKKFQQLCFRKFKGEQMSQGEFDPATAPYEFRKYMAEKILYAVDREKENQANGNLNPTLK